MNENVLGQRNPIKVRARNLAERAQPMWIVAIVLLLVACIPASGLAAIPSSERAALIALYDSTNGGGWADRTNWRNIGDDGFNSPGSECTWHGVTCNVEETAVIALNLSSNQLRGEIPGDLEDLTHLQHLYLQENSLSGPIPPELGNLGSMEVLYLYGNQLTGSIPPELGNLSSIRDLGLAYNQLTGSIPDELGALISLDHLYLSANRLVGNIPSTFSNLSSLVVLYLSSNQLSGVVPTTITDLSGLYDNGGIEIRWNAWHSDDAAVVSFLDQKQSGGDWRSTQTIAPENVGISFQGDHTVWLVWDAVEYQSNPGGYEVFFARSGTTTWSSGGWNRSKTSTTFPLTGLDPGTSYDFVVVTFTDPHEDNSGNTVVSDPSSVVTGVTNSFGCPTPTIEVAGSDPITLTAVGAYSEFLWSTTETTQSIQVSLTSAQWFWVTVDDGDSCVESAAVLVDPDHIFSDGFESGNMSAWSMTVS